MANTLTGLVQTMYQGLDVVSRENVGAIMAVNKNAEASMAAVGQIVRTPIVPETTISPIVPAMIADNAGGQTIGYKDITITRSEKAEILWNGEEVAGTSQYGKILQDQFSQAFRKLSNEVEGDIVAAAMDDATGANIGSGSAVPFGTGGHEDFAAINRAFRDAGADGAVKNAVLSSAALANLQGANPSLYKANEANSDQLLRDGIVTRVQGINFYDSAAFDTDDSLVLTPNAVQLVARTPHLPAAGDAAMDRMTVVDPKSGLAFDVAMYAGYHQVKIEVGLAWGVSVIKPEHVFKLLGEV